MSDQFDYDVDATACFADAAEMSGAADIRCEGCGTSLLDLYKDGRMGCSRCYSAFSSTVHRALIVLHGANIHIGKSTQSESQY